MNRNMNYSGLSLVLLILAVLSSQFLCVSGSKSDISAFGHCIRQQPNPGIMKCVGHQAITSLQSLEDTDNFTLSNGLLMIKDESLMTRSIPNILNQDPMDFRGILENAGAIVGQRSLQWDMGTLYPGLMLRIGPAYDSNSVLEFIMDTNLERGDHRYNEEPSTARILTKQFLLPLLLGLKFNLATVMPLIFAGIILLCKKAAFLAKIALLISGVFGLKGLFAGGLLEGLALGIKKPPIYHDSFGGGYYKSAGDVEAYRSHDPRVVEVTEKEEASTTTSPYSDNFYNFEKQVLLLDRHGKLYSGKEGRNQRSFDTRQSNHRSFAWKTV